MFEYLRRVCHLQTYQQHATASERRLTYLRGPLRRHKGPCLDGPQPSTCQPLDQLYLCSHRNRCLLILQPVSWPNFYNANSIAARGGRGKGPLMTRVTGSETRGTQANKPRRHSLGQSQREQGNSGLNAERVWVNSVVVRAAMVLSTLDVGKGALSRRSLDAFARNQHSDLPWTFDSRA